VPIPYAGVKGATCDLEKLRQFRTWYPHANFGVVMGTISGHFVIETDGPKGRSFLQRYVLSPTPTVISRRGDHKYLKIPPGYTVKTTHLPELDIIGDGDYVVGPGSIHHTGHVYHWQEYLSLTDLEPDYPPEPLLSWMAEHGILRRGATPKYSQTSRGRLKSTSHAFSQRDHPTQSASGTTMDRKPGTAPQGGFKTIFTPILETCGTPLESSLAELAKKPDIRDACLAFLGLDDVGFAKAFLCRLPGHRERHPSAVLMLGENDHAVYHDLHASDGELPVYTLVDYYRAQLRGRALGRDEALKGPVLMPWWERLLVEVGYLETVPIPARTLPDRAPESVRCVYRKFIYLCGCKWLYEPGQPTTFSVRFGMEWCGIGSHHTFREALRWLLQHGYIKELLPYQSAKGQNLALYLPGTPERGIR
jgi:hypothetical protein